MKRICCAWLVICAARIAGAQAPGAVAPPAAPFLEKRVPEELASEGILLSRHNVGLQIEQLGTKWLVSLVDLSTGRVWASTRVDALPPDREAAVAVMTQVVADLAAQIDGRPAPAPFPAPAPPRPPPPAPPPESPPQPDDPIEERDELIALQAAEVRFKRESIHFGKQYQIVAASNLVALVPRWVAYQGELGREMSPDEFYATVDRFDLFRAYQKRHSTMINSFAAGAVVTAVGLAISVSALSDDCKSGDPAFDDCSNGKRDKLLAGLGVAAAGSIGLWIGYWFLSHPHPIDENEAKRLADVYNQHLRGRLGLPVVRSEPMIRDLRIAPRITRSDNGLVLSARF